MLTYFNYLTQQNESIDTALDFYLLPIENGKFLFVVSPEAAEETNNDAITRISDFLTISRKQVDDNQQLLFQNSEVKKSLLTRQQVIDAFGFDSVHTQPDSFGMSFPVFSIENIHQYRQLLNSPDTPIREKRALAKALIILVGFFSTEFINNALNIQTLISLLNSTNDPLTKRYTIKVLSFLVMFHPEDIVNALSNPQNIVLLLSLLNSNDLTTKRYAMTVMWSLVFSSTPYLANKIAICKNNGIEILMSLSSSVDELTKKSAIQTIACLSKHLVIDDYLNQIQVNNIGPLISSLESSDNELKHYVVIALANLAWSNNANQDAIFEADGIEPLVLLLNDPDDQFKQYAAQALEALTNPRIINANPSITLLATIDSRTKQFLNNRPKFYGANTKAVRKANSIRPLIALMQQSSDGCTKKHVENTLRNLGVDLLMIDKIEAFYSILATYPEYISQTGNVFSEELDKAFLSQTEKSRLYQLTANFMQNPDSYGEQFQAEAQRLIDNGRTAEIGCTMLLLAAVILLLVLLFISTAFPMSIGVTLANALIASLLTFVTLDYKPLVTTGLISFGFFDPTTKTLGETMQQLKHEASVIGLR